MKLQQLRYIVEVVNHKLNVSLTAENLYTSQPGISKQIKLLEDELGVQIFVRSGKQLTSITPVGEKIIAAARDILYKSNDIKVIANEFKHPNVGTLAIVTTHTQARYALPSVIQQFMQSYPEIQLQLEQGTTLQSLKSVMEGHSDFAIISELHEPDERLIALPCYHWNQAIIVTQNHPLASCQYLTIDELAKYPLVSYDFSNDGSDLHQAFAKVNKTPNIVFSTADSDLIKTYVRLGIGVGIVANMAMDSSNDSDLVVLGAGHIFSYSTTYIVFQRSLFLRNYMYDFLSIFSPHLSRRQIENALSCETNTEILTMFNGIKLEVK